MKMTQRSTDEHIEAFAVFEAKIRRECPDEDFLSSVDGDPELNRERPMHISSIVMAFSCAILVADDWEEKQYKTPPAFSGMLNWISFMLRKEVGHSVFVISPKQAVTRTMELAEEHPSYRQWGDAERLNWQAVRSNMLEYLNRATSETGTNETQE